MSFSDFLPEIVFELDTLRKHEEANNQKFKALAYTKVINQLKKLKRVDKIEDLNGVTGIGKGIRERIEEILKNGHLQETLALHKAEAERQEAETKRRAEADVAAERPPQAVVTAAHAIDTFKQIHGVGAVAAKKLVDVRKILTITELRDKSAADPKLLNATQKKGLLYYEQFLERIPREEMKAHSNILKKIMKKTYPTLEIDVVGSYRRGELTSGDIDVLIKLPADKTDDFGKQVLTNIVEKMKEKSYIVDNLALGAKKFMGVSKIKEDAPVRRLDIMITPESHYAFAIMYFTGSMNFNIGVRRIALEKGYSMNEYGLTPNVGIPPAPLLKTEEEIFAFLGLKMIKPKYRVDEKILEKKMLKDKKPAEG